MGEREHLVRQENMATTSTAVSTVPQTLPEEAVDRVVITLRPTTTLGETRKKVVWTEDTVDNENMNKKKSKCCCIYVKPRKFDESDSDSSDSECEHCFGHVEKKKKKRATPQTHQRAITFSDTEQVSAAPVTIATITLQPESEISPLEPEPAPPEKSHAG